MIKGWMIFAIMSGGSVERIPYATGHSGNFIKEKQECLNAVKILQQELGDYKLDFKCVPFMGAP